MDNTEETVIDDTLNQMVDVIKTVHKNAVMNLKQNISDLKRKVKCLKSEKRILEGKFDTLKDELLALSGDLTAKVNEKSLLYQLISALTKTVDNACNTVPSNSAADMGDFIPSSNIDVIGNALEVNSLIDSLCKQVPVRTTYEQMERYDDGNSGSQREGLRIDNGPKLQSGLHRFSKVGERDLESLVVDCSPEELSENSRNVVDVDTSPMSHLLGLISSTHHWTVKPLRSTLAALKQELEEVQSEVDGLKVKSHCLSVEKQNTNTKLNTENKCNVQMRNLFKALSQRLTHGHVPKSNQSDTEVEFPSMVKTWRITGESAALPSTDFAAINDESVIIEVQPVEAHVDVDYCVQTSSTTAQNNANEHGTIQGKSMTTLSTPNAHSTKDMVVTVSPSSHKQSTPSGQGVVAPQHRTNEQPQNRCNTCGLNFSDYLSLSKHKRSHRSLENVCRLCKRPFSSSTALKIHMRRHTGERPYLCQECGKTFAQAISLRIHLRKHTGERPHKCFDCGREFHDPCYFKKHQRKHLENRSKK